MKAHLLYRSRDVDFTLTMHQGRLEVAGHDLPGSTDDLTQDLELSPVLDAMGGGDNLLREIARRVLLSSIENPADITYRQAVLRDCVENEQVVRDLLSLALRAVVEERKISSWFLRQPEAVVHRAVEALELFVRRLRQLRQIVDSNAESFSSEGFTELFATLQRELSDEYFDAIDDHLRRLRFRDGVFVSAALGPGLAGTNYVLRTPTAVKVPLKERLRMQARTEYHWDLHPRDEAGARALSEIRDRGLRLVADALSQSTNHISSFFLMLGIELGFCVSCLNLRTRLRSLGRPICFPEPAAGDQRHLDFGGLCDVSLALLPSLRVVGNDVAADGKILLMITGANSGGKSTFLRSVGQAQLMMQAGMFVVADHYGASTHNRIFSHFIREEDREMKSGKLDEELARMSAIAEYIRPGSIVFFNESFAATNEREGSEIAGQIVNALLDSDVMVVFVTHQFTLAELFARELPELALFLRATREDDGTRTFKLVEGRPLATSFGEDLYERVGGWDSRL